MKTATLKPTMIERCYKSGYKWVNGWIVYTPEGNEIQPYMQYGDAIKFCKSQGWKYKKLSS